MKSVRRLGALVLLLCACTPALDWREVRVADTPLAVSWPCRPASHARRVTLAGGAPTMTLFACTADGATFALGWLPVDDPARMGEVLGALRAAAAANLGSAEAQRAPFGFSGVTPNPAAGHWQLAGKGQGGGALAAQVAVFAVGAVAYQATIIGAGPDSEPARVFLASIRLAR